MDHDMAMMTSSTISGMPMSTGMSMSTATPSAAATMNMGGMGGGGSCKISMLWNWYTIDACFLAKSWHITSHGMFAGSCIGVILLVMLLELLRRASKEYDKFILHEYRRAHSVTASVRSESPLLSSSDSNKNGACVSQSPRIPSTPAHFRPSVLQQMIRALLHVLQFTVAYLVMLLAMYYNGYIIICIFIGAYLGSFVFGWESISLQPQQGDVTVCCG